MKKSLSYIKIAASLLLIMLFTSSVFGQSERNTDMSRNLVTQPMSTSSGTKETLVNPFTVPSAYELVGEMETTVLYADMETGNFIFGDKKGNKLWYSTPNDLDQDEITVGSRRSQIRSQLLVDYVDLRTVSTSTIPETASSYRDSVESGNAKVIKIERGIRIEFSFPDIGIWVPVEFSLQEDCLSAQIKGQEIREDSYNQIVSLHLLPCFTAGGVSESGYLFIPDGSGALASFNSRSDAAEYDKPVYGTDAALEKKKDSVTEQQIIMPVFGVKTGNYALTGIITQGDEISNIYANLSGENIGYNRVYPKMVTAVSDSTTLFEADYFNTRKIFRLEKRDILPNYEVRYFSLSSEEADYVGMAKTYQQYLLDHQLLSKKPVAPSLSLNIYGAAEKKASFLGIPYQKLFSMTTFEQAQEMLETLNQAGVDHLAVQYSGWNNRGLVNQKVPTKAKPLSVLGGKSKYLSLQKYIDSLNGEFYSSVDFVNFRKSGHSFSALSDVSMSMFHTRVQQFSYLRSVYVSDLSVDPWYLLKPQQLSQAAEKFFVSFGKWNVPGGVMVEHIGKTVYSDFDKNGSDRSASVEYYKSLLESNQTVPLSAEYGNAYVYSYIERLFNLPNTHSGNLIFDESVPFAQIVLHGYLPFSSEDINRATDPQKMLLKCIETGSDPYFCGMYEDASVLLETNFDDLYSSSFSSWSDIAIQIYRQYSQVYQQLYDQSIVGHAQVGTDVYQTTFENGSVVLVNYSDTDQVIDGTSVLARNFSVKGGQ